LKAPVGQLGPILAGISLGGLIGSTWLDRWDPPHARFRALIAGGLGVMGLAVMGIVWVGTYPGAITLAVISGIGNVAAVIPLLTWIQITVPAAMRGRVLAARRMGLGLAGAVGSIAAGSAATRLGTPATLFALAGCLVIAAVIAWVGLHPERLAYRESASALSD
jgi:MFS family permease